MADNGLKPRLLYAFLVLSLISYCNRGGYEKHDSLSWNLPPYSPHILENKILETITDSIFHIKNKSDTNIDEEKTEESNEIVDKVNELRDITGMDVIGYEKHTFEISLNCENGFGNITATGKTLEDGMIANNFLEFGTKVYIEGLGLKTVEDRGSKKYFNAVNKADVFVPRNHGESDSEYYKRVNNLGRRYINGYILYFEE